jgi:hypothetical protein
MKINGTFKGKEEKKDQKSDGGIGLRIWGLLVCV